MGYNMYNIKRKTSLICANEGSRREFFHGRPKMFENMPVAEQVDGAVCRLWYLAV